MNYQSYIQENQEKNDNDDNSKSIFKFNSFNENDDISEDCTEIDKDNFKSKRSSHYNEFKIMQAMKLKMKSHMNDEDEDEDEDNYINDSNSEITYSGR